MTFKIGDSITRDNIIWSRALGRLYDKRMEKKLLMKGRGYVTGVTGIREDGVGGLTVRYGTKSIGLFWSELKETPAYIQDWRKRLSI